MKTINASIITIGDELLIGQTIDTNSAFIGKEFNLVGIWVRRRVAVGDVPADIIQALDEESKISSVIILTGGLGPTDDDKTKEVLCEYFGGKMIVDPAVLAHIKYLFEKIYQRTGPILDRNLKQAEVPDVCTVLPNARGSAPGMWFEREGVIFVSLPGVPNEMEALIRNEVIPRLREHFTFPVILHQTLLTAGAGESMIAEKIMDWEKSLPSNMTLAYLPHYAQVRLRITALGDNRNELEIKLEQQFAQLKELVDEWLVIDEDMSMQQAIAKLLKSRKQTCGTAESCTGGYIAHLLSKDSGASSNYKGTVVSYDNQVKIDLLGVSPETLKKEGAVCEEVVRQMIRGALSALKCDYAIATSGIMGPDGGSEHKPVGRVWIAVGNNENTVASEFNFRFDRNRNIEMTAITALNMLRKFILANS